MKIIEPSAELWQANSWQEMVAKAARVCYASNGGKRTDEEMCKMLWDSGHRSMFRHGTKYFVAKNIKRSGMSIVEMLQHIPYAATKVFFSQIGGDGIDMVMSTNCQFAKEQNLYSKDGFVEVPYSHIIDRYGICSIERVTICLVTQISTSRELNRTSPNNIAEQSTRYVNFGKRGGIAICRPHWYNKIGRTGRFLTRLYWHACEFAYNMALRFGLPAEDAREFLPLCAATKVVYTYTRDEWEHILDLRLRGTTGAPHPNAKEAAQLINDLLN